MLTFASNDDARDWADRWTSERVPTPLVLQIIDDEHAHFARFNVDYGRYVGQFEVAYQSLAELIDHLNFVDRSAWPPHRYVQYVLSAYNLRTFYSALDRLVRGYYEDCLALTRGLYETFVRMLFVSCHPDSAYNVLVRKPPKGERTFNLTNFLRDDLGLGWETKYEIFSIFAHSNSLHVLEALKRAGDRDGDPERFRVRIEYEPAMIEAAAPLLQFVLTAHLRFAVERFAEVDPPLPTERLQDASDALALLTHGLTTHAKEHWRMVAADLDMIFGMLVKADRREDWRTCLPMRV
jgi:hypothetical protein